MTKNKFPLFKYICYMSFEDDFNLLPRLLTNLNYFFLICRHFKLVKKSVIKQLKLMELRLNCT